VVDDVPDTGLLHTRYIDPANQTGVVWVKRAVCFHLDAIASEELTNDCEFSAIRVRALALLTLYVLIEPSVEVEQDFLTTLGVSEFCNVDSAEFRARGREVSHGLPIGDHRVRRQSVATAFMPNGDPAFAVAGELGNRLGNRWILFVRLVSDWRSDDWKSFANPVPVLHQNRSAYQCFL
ncbi:MAG: hypothetical protein WA757_03290, partial [Candidatus Acidiferrales bacterium]